jgi:hypothetical protein
MSSSPDSPSPTAEESAPSVPRTPAEAFVHLHVHSEYSMLRATSRTSALIKAAQAAGQTALALTTTPESPPEIMTAREMLAVGGSLVRLSVPPTGR